MRILVLGIGLMGSVLLKDLIRSDEVSEVIACDIDIHRLKQYVNELKSEKVKAEYIDATDYETLVNRMKGGFDVVASCLFTPLNYDVAKAAIEAGVSFVNLASPSTIYQLDESAKAAGVTIIPSCGHCPGIRDILIGYAARNLDKVVGIYIWCGYLPQKDVPTGPLGKFSWWWEGNIRMNLSKAKIFRDGKIVELDKLADPEIVKFPDPVGECESFYYGSPLQLIDQLGLKDVNEALWKVVVPKGWCDTWTKLIDLNLTSTEPIKIEGCEITPRQFLVELGNKYLRYKPGERDVCVMRVKVLGEKNREKTQYSYEAIDPYDEKSGITGTGRATAFPCSIVCQMIGRGDIKEKGVIPPAKIGWNKPLSKLFFTELAKRDIQICEEITTYRRQLSRV